MSPSKAVQDLRVGPPLLLHVLLRVRVDDHIPEGTDGNEVHLRDKVDLVRRRQGDGALDERPEPPDDAEQRRLPATIWARDQHALAALHLEVQVLHEERAVGLVHGDMLELQIRAPLELRGVRTAPRCRDLLAELLRPPKQTGHESAHSARKAAQSADTVRELEQVLDGRRHGLHVAPSRCVVGSDLVCGVSVHPVQSEAQRSRQQEQPDDCHEVFVQILPDRFRVEGQQNRPMAVIQQPAKVHVQHPSLRSFAAGESNLLAIRNQLRVGSAEPPLKVLLFSGQFAEWWQGHRRDARCKSKPTVQSQRRRQSLHTA
mmetsp:Transcript_50185/g.144629  ORF Transcript_50185/g.144629 Transcript_50185/m.144629 type:complete len:316 (-) Transcript_50185:694-1641(-)